MSTNALGKQAQQHIDAANSAVTDMITLLSAMKDLESFSQKEKDVVEAVINRYHEEIGAADRILKDIFG